MTKALVLTIAVLAVAVQSARADNNIYFTGSFNGTTLYATSGSFETTANGGGVIGAYLNGTAPTYTDGTKLNNVYCVDLNHNVNVPGDYTVNYNHTGFIYNNQHSTNSEVTSFNTTQTDAIARELVYAQNLGAGISLQQQAGVQAAIWNTIYATSTSHVDPTSGFASKWVLDTHNANNSATTIAAYEGALAAIGSFTSVHTSDALWINLNNNDQAQVTLNQGGFAPSVPVPGTIVMSSILFGMFGGVAAIRKLRRSAVAA